MTVVQDPNTPTRIAYVDNSLKALRVSPRPVQALGHYSLHARTGALTGVAAGTATLGHIFAFRNTSDTILQVISRIYVQVRTIAGFTGAQEIGYAGYRLTAYTGAHTGGTALSFTAPAFKRRTDAPDPIVSNARIATTGELTAGTHTLDTQPFMQDSFSELAAAATVFKGRFDMERQWNVHEDPFIIGHNEGFIFRNEILMGAGGTVKVAIYVDWSEITDTDYPV